MGMLSVVPAWIRWKCAVKVLANEVDESLMTMQSD